MKNNFSIGCCSLILGCRASREIAERERPFVDIDDDFPDVPPPLKISTENNSKRACSEEELDIEYKHSISMGEAGATDMDIAVTKQTVSMPMESPLFSCSPSSIVSVQPDDEGKQTNKMKVQLEEKDKKIQELMEQNEKLKARRNEWLKDKRHSKRMSRRKKPALSLGSAVGQSDVKRSSMRLHQMVRELTGEKEKSCVSPISLDGVFSENESSKPIAAESMFNSAGMKFNRDSKSIAEERLFSKSMPLKLDGASLKPHNDDVTSDQKSDGKWACSEMMML